MQNQREGKVSLANMKSKCLVLIKRVFSVIIISIILMTISGEIAYADKRGSMVVDIYSFYKEYVYMNTIGSYGVEQSQPWELLDPWVPWEVWK